MEKAVSAFPFCKLLMLSRRMGNLKHLSVNFTTASFAVLSLSLCILICHKFSSIQGSVMKYLGKSTHVGDRFSIFPKMTGASRHLAPEAGNTVFSLFCLYDRD